MAKYAIREKAARFGNNVNHSYRGSNRIWEANVKSVKVKMEDGVWKTYICTSYLRSNFVGRA